MPENTAEIFNEYIENIRKEYATGVAREHAYRPALKQLFQSLKPGTIAINDPARQNVGAPDFQIENADNHQLRQHKIFSSPPLAFVEHKDITEDLDKPEHQDQLKRYLRLGNILHTNGLVFRFYIKDQKPLEIVLAELTPAKSIIVDSAQYNQLTLAYHNLVETRALTIRTPLKLATLMAERAQAIRDIIEAALKNDLQNQRETELTNQFKVFKSQLVHDLDEHKFADLYAQTLAYGLFAARYNDKTLNNFTLVEAAKIMPPTNRFLRKFFQEIAGYESESRINWVLDNLVEVFNRVDVRELMRGAGEEWAKHHDPIIHFYETFLGLYDPQLRKSMGVYYTPQPVVKYIVRSVDEILKKDFGIAAGLADDSKVEREFKGQPITAVDRKRGYSIGKKTVHKVQVLDPALGTGTFLNEAIKNVASQTKPRLGSGWSKYIEQDLLPRLYGFELMMAPYAMANLRLNLTLVETGYKTINPDARLRILLTNSLGAPNENELNQLPFVGFQQILATEAQEADIVKANHNVMVVIGNPPYNTSSNNKSDFIQKLIKDYKKDLNERKINLDDDYIKFIRFAEDMIVKDGEGIVAMITNNSYLDGITHRQMRKHLLETFDKIYVLDLHGSSKKKEVSPDGSQDENVFNIQQGVSILIMVKDSFLNNGLAEIKHAELYGRKIEKFKRLDENKVGFSQLHTNAPNYYFVPKDFSLESVYLKGVKINELFQTFNSGIQTKRDKLLVHYDNSKAERALGDLRELDEESLKIKYDLPEDGRDWTINSAKKDSFSPSVRIINYAYKPFDRRYLIYSSNSKGVSAYPRYSTSKNFLKKNIALMLMRSQVNSRNFSTALVQEDYPDINFYGFQSYAFPLYLYHDDGTRTVNFSAKVLKEFTENLSLEYDPEDILDYVYATLYAPAYRKIYNEFLNIDFPRVPSPVNNDQFKALAEIGKQLRETHLLKDPKLEKHSFTPTGDGDWLVQKVAFKLAEDDKGNVYVNDLQYFADVPKLAWEFYIGGYQPAQKWLKDRKGRELTHQDITHYQKIITALLMTSKLQKNLDNVWGSQ
jgi:predicted helicase